MSEENKFNFSEDTQKNESEIKDEAVKQSKETVKKDALNFYESIKKFFKELLDFRHDTDRDATIEAIKADIPFKGATAWILVCSIFVASIGLNADSPAVVIGAMLISPLMGPILGIGLAIAINDIDTLKRSLINLATMIGLSLLAAFLFFYFFPLSEDTSELLGRVRPDIRDVLIAFFGGSALIIARTKRGTIASVIFGVAIATALMPPLCTAGYGLAKGNWLYFRGAMYLFTINTIFIALATFLVLKILRFPMLKYANSAKRKRIARFASLIAIIVMIPASMTFYDVLQESRFERDFNNFVANEIRANESLWLNRDPVLDRENKRINVYFYGEISEATITDLENELKKGDDYGNIKDFDLIINANKTRSVDRLSESLDRAYKDLDRSDNVISGLQKEIEELQANINKLNLELESSNGKSQFSFTTIAKDAKILFKDLEYFSFAKMLESKDFIRIDTVSVARVTWSKSLNDSLRTVKEKELSQWLKKEVKSDTIFISRN
ncbi:DUF389 domain-containing protein [Lacinutrix sp. 5H-3-7-4]|uniref:DUF389 domain-containing protein n=1 Tax=Lacinutrix sp. (strain 5H-3-7-4) TaxID=983544 RepID=UPI00020A3DC3|nr:DUF389 domain-containing protein [Lacinutrix sp. 5H-3-7-4]AEH01545.1 Conserved hypothetical protein CHP00341 [Lacinutrix sp. 5H-3-7-4]